MFDKPLSATLLSSPFVENLTDGLSFPLSIIYAMQRLKIQPEEGMFRNNFIYIVGGSSTVEEAQVSYYFIPIIFIFVFLFILLFIIIDGR